jgi:hypothetical protein
MRKTEVSKWEKRTVESKSLESPEEEETKMEKSLGYPVRYRKDSSITIRRLFIFMALATILTSASVVASAEQITFSHRYYITGAGIGLVGYDPVAYWPEGGGHPKKGLFALTFEYDGVTYRFATQQNLDRFKTAPTKYLPQYGGWCAYGAALNGRGDADPESFVIRDGKLYLFYRDPGGANRDLWLKDPKSFIQKADANWPSLSH